MKDFWRIIKLMKWWIISSILFLIIVQVLFTIPAPCKWLDAAWEAGDLISFVGTIVLGIVAIMQTKDANDMSKRLMQLEENRYKLEMRPFVILEDWMAFEKDEFQIRTQPDQLYISLCKGCGATAFCLAFTLTNTTQSYVSVTYGGAKYTDSNKSVSSSGFSYSNIQNKALRLQPGESNNMVFYGKREEIIKMFHTKKIQFQFFLQNRFGERYREDFTALVLIREPPKGGTKPSLPHVIIEDLDYRIEKSAGGHDKVDWEDNNGCANIQ